MHPPGCIHQLMMVSTAPLHALQISVPPQASIEGGAPVAIVDNERMVVATGYLPRTGWQPGSMWLMTKIKAGCVAVERCSIVPGEVDRAATVYPAMDISDARIFASQNLQQLSLNVAPPHLGSGMSVLGVGAVFHCHQLRVARRHIKPFEVRGTVDLQLSAFVVCFIV